MWRASTCCGTRTWRRWWRPAGGRRSRCGTPSTSSWWTTPPVASTPPPSPRWCPRRCPARTPPPWAPTCSGQELYWDLAFRRVVQKWHHHSNLSTSAFIYDYLSHAQKIPPCVIIPGSGCMTPTVTGTLTSPSSWPSSTSCPRAPPRMSLPASSECLTTTATAPSPRTRVWQFLHGFTKIFTIFGDDAY